MTDPLPAVAPVFHGRWSGGGVAVCDNVRTAMRLRPETLGTRGARHLVMRNVVPPRLLLRGGCVYMPQNALAWSPVVGDWRERLRQIAWKLASRAALARACGVIRLSSAVRVDQGGGGILPNVLDESFEDALEESLTIPSPAPDAWVCLGRLSTYRNHATLVAGYQVYREGGGRVPLYVRGSAQSNRVRRNLEAGTAGTAGLVVEPHGATRAEVLALLRSSHGAIFPSLCEVTSIGVLEALAVAPRVLVSEVPGHVEAVRSVAAAVPFFGPEDPAGLAAAMREADLCDPMSAPPAIASKSARSRSREIWVRDFTDRIAEIAKGCA
ncbi:MAG: glycosyltransferase [Acidimicrobiia bacterium]|nr:glycosyltransferase [Acidimicrobiia bacterium]